MRIIDLNLKSFRNHKNLNIEFSGGCDIFNGPNGAGKTNILEAISVLSIVKSFRGASDNDLIMWGDYSYYCEANLTESDESRFSIGYSRVGNSAVKKMSIDQIEIKSGAEYYGKFLTVVFSPTDIILMDGSADNRRKYFDSVISKYNEKYFASLRDYKKILYLRNTFLKENAGGMNPDMRLLSVWTQMLAEKSQYIVLTRKAFALEFNKIFMQSYSEILDDARPPELIYRNKMNAVTIDDFNAAFNLNIKRDIALGYTSTGPHRDDYLIRNESGIDFAVYGSRGQKRSASIALKIAEAEIIEKLTGHLPVLLVDDVFSELDAGRRHNLSKLFLGSRQIIITMPDYEELPFFNKKDGKRFLVNIEGIVNEI